MASKGVYFYNYGSQAEHILPAIIEAKVQDILQRWKILY